MVKIDKTTDALIITDLQNDFCPGGALGVPKGDQIISPINSIAKKFTHIYATLDWHPNNHCTFKSHGGSWPTHCLANSFGSKLHSKLKIPQAQLIYKGINPQHLAFSGFDHTKLKKELTTNKITRLFIGGLATDYCVKETVLDALKHQYTVYLLKDCIKGINLQPNDSTQTLKVMKQHGAKIISSSSLA